MKVTVKEVTKKKKVSRRYRSRMWWRRSRPTFWNATRHNAVDKMTRGRAAATSERPIERNVFRRQAGQARARHAVTCHLNAQEKECRNDSRGKELFVTEDREVWRDERKWHCEAVTTTRTRKNQNSQESRRQTIHGESWNCLDHNRFGTSVKGQDGGEENQCGCQMITQQLQQHWEWQEDERKHVWHGSDNPRRTSPAWTSTRHFMWPDSSMLRNLSKNKIPTDGLPQPFHERWGP